MKYYYTYVLMSEKDHNFYTGSTKDLRKRFNDHNSGKVLSTKNRGLFKLIYYEACLNEQDARPEKNILNPLETKPYAHK